jgi:hypothetical protein
VKDGALAEDVFDTIKVFQSSYATRPDLIPPESDENIVVEIEADGPHSSLEAYLLSQWATGQACPIALKATVKVWPGGPLRFNGYHFHQHTLELQR